LTLLEKDNIIEITTWGSRSIILDQGSHGYYDKARSRGVGDRLTPLYVEFPKILIKGK